jgi:hypothetical protein
MLVLPSSKHDHFSLHFLPAIPQFLKFDRSSIITCHNMSPASSHSRSCYEEPCSRESSYDSQTSSRSQTIHSRRTKSRTNSNSRTPPPPALSGFSDFFHSRVSTPISITAPRESDAECWERMLGLQKEYHCYKSARLEAAVEALEQGCAIEEVPMRKFSPFPSANRRG